MKKGIVVAVLAVLLLTQPVLACTWDPIVSKCHPAMGEVVVYKHGSCNGSEYFSFNGNNQMEYSSVLGYTWPGGGSLNDSISCYVIGHKTTFYYYQHINYGGKSVKDENTASDRMKQKNLSGTWWNDSISSVKVFPK